VTLIVHNNSRVDHDVLLWNAAQFSTPRWIASRELISASEPRRTKNSAFR
jgi:hypothetical protein